MENPSYPLKDQHNDNKQYLWWFFLITYNMDFLTIKCSLTSTDVENPTISCPAAFFASSEPISWPDPTVTDNIDTQLTVTCTPSSGSRDFNAGANTVTCTATDDAQRSAMCSFTVTLGKMHMVFICNE